MIFRKAIECPLDAKQMSKAMRAVGKLWKARLPAEEVLSDFLSCGLFRVPYTVYLFPRFPGATADQAWLQETRDHGPKGMSLFGVSG